MAKKRMSSPKVIADKPAKPMTVKDPRSGQDIVLYGYGAMADSGFAINKSVSLLEPIADQALKRLRKREIP